MRFNRKIDDVLAKLRTEDVFTNYIIRDYFNSISDDVLYSIKCNITRIKVNYNYTYCSDINDDMYEISYFSNSNFIDMVIAKHHPVYDENNKYLGRELNYLLRVSTEDNNSNCVVYYKDGDYVYNNNITTYNDVNKKVYKK